MMMRNRAAALLAGLAALGWAQTAQAQSGKIVPVAPVAPAPAAPVAAPAAAPAAAPVAEPAPKPVAPAIALPAAPANNVHCVFDNLTIEDREITLMLIGLDFLNEGRYARIAPPNKIVDRLVLEALPRCADPYRWSPAASQAAVAYAHAMLVQDVLRQAIEYEDLTIDPVEQYYRENRTRLAGKSQLDELMEEGFATHLRKGGWKESERGGRLLARVYIEVLLARETTEQAFTKAVAPRAAVKRPKRRAKTASRGRS
ncbi:MAG: hypothetical protein ABL914_12860 [Novosphingobium sp.]|uniref:hypothetical protein n=1 Tax=Novosphingobium sp. TaxID=1874826 RepID=UPI0032BCA3A0